LTFFLQAVPADRCPDTTGDGARPLHAVANASFD
jgi:hypothetical protein